MIMFYCCAQASTIGAASPPLLGTMSILKRLGLTWINWRRHAERQDSPYGSGSQPMTTFWTGPASSTLGFEPLPPPVKMKSYKAPYENLRSYPFRCSNNPDSRP